MARRSARRFLPSGLATRIIALLSIALIPLGAIAFVQTSALSEETRLRTQLDLEALTIAAVSEQHAEIVRAGGAAQALGVAGGYLVKDPRVCSVFAERFVARHNLYSFAGLVVQDGRMRCASMPTTVDFSTYAGFDDIMAHPSARIVVNPNPPMSGEPVVVVSEPFSVAGGFAGYASVSLPTAHLDFGADAPRPEGMVELILFSADGHIVVSKAEADTRGAVLPERFDLQAMPRDHARSFPQTGADGTERIFTIVPVLPGQIYALSIWQAQGAAGGVLPVNATAGVLPLMMWVASVLVAFLAVDRMVIRPIRVLGQRMRRFARTRAYSGRLAPVWMSEEVRAMEEDFAVMAESIMRDEAAQEDQLREKSILLKEVHHRVKNNLQLISSIMNMQIRRAEVQETRDVLSGLQDRIQNLATIYRRLYQTSDLGHIDVAALLQDVVDRILQSNAVVRNRAPDIALEPVELFPDQAMPLTLLVAEALANALAYAPHPSGRISIRFGPAGPDKARIEIVNDIADGVVSDETGLGLRLMRAFAMQLGGDLERDTDGGRHRIAVTFLVADFKPETVDY